MPAHKTPVIVSFLPAATEMACALGLEAHIAGVSFECDFPPSIMDRPRVVTTAIDMHNMTPRQIDEEVTALTDSGKSLYVIDELLLKQLRPDVILTQDLCRVCAPSGKELAQVLSSFDYQPQVICMSPHSLADIEHNLLQLAEATGKTTLGKSIAANWHRRIDAVRERISRLPRRPRVFVMEWVDPVYCAGHWLAEMIDIAGGNDRFARKGADSARIDWNEVVEWQPEIIIVAPCGYNQQQAEEQLPLLYSLPGWHTLPAVQTGQVHAVDANACFVRPGLRVIEGLEIIEHLLISYILCSTPA